MSTKEMELIRDICVLIGREGEGFVPKLGQLDREISDGVTKYLSRDARITHFIVFSKNQRVDEVSFYCKGASFLLSELEKELGVFRHAYNFRENYTQFTFDRQDGNVQNIFFVADNKFEPVANGAWRETTPRGQTTLHHDVKFEAFCVKMRP
jgi:hypothetical protein